MFGGERAGLGWGMGLLTDPDGQQPGRNQTRDPESFMGRWVYQGGLHPESIPWGTEPLALQPGMPRVPRLGQRNCMGLGRRQREGQPQGSRESSGSGTKASAVFCPLRG